MTPERWRLVGDLFARVLEQPDDARGAWLDACAAPDEVRREVAALLAAHAGADGFLERPAAAAEAEAETTAGPLTPALHPGAIVGSYRIGRILGRGGMGVVFEAEDLRLHRRVALKAVSSPRGATAADEQRLRREARAAAALVHPNIATVYALEDIDGHAYISSEYLEGETLREVLRHGPLARERTLAIAHALGDALVVAHGRGVVHRDLKPENVLHLSDGRVKVLDFGLARLEGEARHLASASRLTLPGFMAGTPGYMAPEQLLGLDADARVDQFALGALIAELALGANPFEAGTLPATIARVMASDGLPPAAQALLPADLAALIHRLTRQRPGDRFPTASAVVEAIASCQRGTASVGVVSSRPALTATATPLPFSTWDRDPATGRRPALWWWRFHQAAAAAVYWLMIGPAWLVHRQVPPRLPWFLACLAATIVAANVRLHLRFSAAVLPRHLPAQRGKTRGWVALADWSLILLWTYAAVTLVEIDGQWSAVFFAFALGAALAVVLIEPATTKAAFDRTPPAPDS